MNYFRHLTGTSNGLRRDLLRSISGMVGVKLVNLVLAFISSILVARSLGPAGYGAYAFIMSLVGFFALLSYLGLPELMVREIAKYEQARQWGLIRGLLHKSHLFVAGIAILLMLLAATGNLIFSTSTELDRWRLLLIALPLIPVISMASLRTAALRGLRKVVMGAIPEMVIKPAAFLVMLLWLTSVGKVTAGTAILAQLGAALGALLVGILLFRRVAAEKVKSAAPEYENREWLSALLPFMGLAGVSFLNVEFINIFLGFSGTNQDVAMFRAAASIALIVALPLSLIESVISPYITRLYHAGELGKLQKLIQVASLAALLSSAVPAIILLLFSTETVTIFYGSDYAPAYSTLVVIVLGYMFVNLVGLSMQLLYATEYHVSAFRISAYGAVVTVLLCTFLIPYYGALGAGIALGFGKALRSVFFVIEARRRLEIKTSLIW